MQRGSAARIDKLCHQILRSKPDTFREKTQPLSCDVFINHRGIDTKRNVAGLLHHHLRLLGLRPFLDSKNMNPGDKLFDKIDVAIKECKVGVAIFSPTYCDSYFCLHELCLMMESKKKVLPIFCDVKPSNLQIKKYEYSNQGEELDKFKLVLEEAKLTVGLTFDSLRGDWSEFLENSSNAVIKNLIEVDQEEPLIKKLNTNAILDGQSFSIN